MNTVKHLKDSSLRHLRKRPFPSWINRYLPSMLLASLLGTYLDAFLVAKQFYEFPIRPLPGIFSINIAFTLVILPIFVLLFLHLMRLVNNWGRVGLIIFLSLMMPIFERFAELCGWFSHSSEWNHLYTLIGYLGFLTVIYVFYQWMEKN